MYLDLAWPNVANGVLSGRYRNIQQLEAGEPPHQQSVEDLGRDDCLELGRARSRRIRVLNAKLYGWGSYALPSLTCKLDQRGDKICIFGFSRGAYT
jgi:hypothetical protein